MTLFPLLPPPPKSCTLVAISKNRLFDDRVQKLEQMQNPGCSRFGSQRCGLEHRGVRKNIHFVVERQDGENMVIIMRMTLITLVDRSEMKRNETKLNF